MTPSLKGGAWVWTPPQLCVPFQALSFGFIVRSIGDYRQKPRRHPVLLGDERSQGNVTSPNQITMEREMTVLTDKEQAVLGAVVLAGVSSTRSSLRGEAGIDFDRHAPSKDGFVGDHAV